MTSPARNNIPMGKAVMVGRQHSCATCPTPCATPPDVTLEESACPMEPPRWRAWAQVTRVPARTGLGDVAAAVAGPIAGAIDAATAGTRFATNLKNCPGCGQRKETLNAAVPDVLRPLRGRRP